MLSKIKVGDRVRVIAFSKIVNEGIIEEIIIDHSKLMAYGGGYENCKVNGTWHSDFFTIEKISEGESLDEKKIEEKVKEKVEGKNRTTMEEDFLSVLI